MNSLKYHDLKSLQNLLSFKGLSDVKEIPNHRPENPHLVYMEERMRFFSRQSLSPNENEFTQLPINPFSNRAEIENLSKRKRNFTLTPLNSSKEIYFQPTSGNFQVVLKKNYASKNPTGSRDPLKNA